MTITPLRNRMIVRLEGTSNGKLSDYTSEGGIVMLGGDMDVGYNITDGLKDRWAEVLAVGPTCTDIKKGDRVLITQGKWTEAARVGSVYFWMTEEEHVLLVDDAYRASDGEQKTVATVM